MGTRTARTRRLGRYKRTVALWAWRRGFKSEFALQNGLIHGKNRIGKIKKEFF